MLYSYFYSYSILLNNYNFIKLNLLWVTYVKKIHVLERRLKICIPNALKSKGYTLNWKEKKTLKVKKKKGKRKLKRDGFARY
jgi:hypothetical protein